jgi:hypothetical protein
MDERTEELKELFVETTGAEEVTETQEAEPGDLAGDVAPEDAPERVEELVARMRERYDFQSGLDDPALARTVLGFYAGADDAELADTLDVDEATVFTARMDLHLLRDADRDPPFPFDDLRELVVADVPLDERAERLEAGEETVEQYSQAVAADLRSTRANHRFVDAFTELLTDAELSESHAADARESGLEEAAEDIETNTQL